MKKRISFIDISKGIAILCIILGHFGIEKIDSFVFTFHVPLFFLITGYFINKKDTIKELVYKKYKTLVVPYIITCSIIILLATIKSILSIDLISGIKTAINWLYASMYGSGISYYEPFYIKAIGAIWFLLANFWGSIFLRISLEFNAKIQILIIMLLFLFGIWSNQLFWFPLSIQAGCCSTMYMYLGYLFKQKEEKLKKMNFNFKLIVSIIALIIWIQFIFNFKSFLLVRCDVGRGIIDILGTLCGSYIIILISMFIEKHLKIIKNFLTFMGKYSLFVLCIHIIELNLFNWHNFVFLLGLHKYTLFFIIIFKLTFIVSVTYICSKNSFIKKFFNYRET